MKTVEIYTSDTCIQCVKAKEFLKTNNVEYTEHNISKNSEAQKKINTYGVYVNSSYYYK